MNTYKNIKSAEIVEAEQAEETISVPTNNGELLALEGNWIVSHEDGGKEVIEEDAFKKEYKASASNKEFGKPTKILEVPADAVVPGSKEVDLPAKAVEPHVKPLAAPEKPVHYPPKDQLGNPIYK